MRKMKRVLLLGMMITMMLGLTGCGTRTIDLNKYVTVDISGYNTMGTATYRFDSEAFTKDYEGKIKYKRKEDDFGSNMVAAISEMGGPTSAVDICTKWSLDKKEGLSNGDIVTLTWEVDNEAAKKYYGCKFVGNDLETEVKGLVEVNTINPFDYVEVSFSGVSPDGTVLITPNYDQAEIQYVKFTADKSNGLKVGDTITVTASIVGSVDAFVEQFGSVLGETEKTYTVDSLARYITDISDVPEDMYQKMDQQLQDNFKAHAASSWVNGYCASEFTQVENYLLTLKDGMSGTPHNYLYYVYRVTIPADKLNSTSDFTYYWYGYFTDIMILADETCTVDLSNYTVSESYSGWGYQSGDYLPCGDNLYVAGFADLDTFFNQQIVTKIESYEYKKQCRDN